MMELTRRHTIAMLGGLLLALGTTHIYAQQAKKPLSPPAQASVVLKGKTITIDYSAPSMRGRKIAGELVPYNKVWRTGANAATTLKTPINLKIGTLSVPAGTYTIYSLPTANDCTLIINKQTGQWGTEYDESKDLGRVGMTAITLPDPVETFVIKFDPVQKDATELHLVWENTDLSVPVVAE
ncbi:MAG TPA: DUF2911 domain-containing protein [Acidisarcina sp.]|nr:DUF2911 domain-containing protein [Acidisarcina sp.]